MTFGYGDIRDHKSSAILAVRVAGKWSVAVHRWHVSWWTKDSSGCWPSLNPRKRSHWKYWRKAHPSKAMLTFKIWCLRHAVLVGAVERFATEEYR